MDETKVTVTSVLAGVCWTAGLVLAVVNVVVPVDLIGFVVLAAASASVLTLRTLVSRSAVKTAQAFQLGREAERRLPQGPRGV